MFPSHPWTNNAKLPAFSKRWTGKIETEAARKEVLDTLFRSLLHHLMTAKIRLPKEFVKRFVEEDER